MIMRALIISIISVLTTAFTLAHATDTTPAPRLTVELRDGSRVVGDSVEQNFQFRSTLLGDFKLPVKDVRSVEFIATNSAKIITVNNDSLTVTLLAPEIPVKTSFGKVELATVSIRKFSVTISPNGGGREGLVFFWAGSGNGNNNISTDPETPDQLRQTGVVMVSHKAALVSMQDTRQLTFEAWIKPNSIPHSFPVLLSKGGNHPGGAYGGYEFILNAKGDNDLVFASGGCLYLTRNANGRWINNHLGQWIHVAFTLNDRTKSAKFYINGQPTNDEALEGSNNNLNLDLSNNLYIGSPDPASHPNRSRFDGEMRDVKLFNRTLSSEEIREDYEAGKADE